MDFIARYTQIGAFKQVTLFGSCDDGYVDFMSALLLIKELPGHTPVVSAARNLRRILIYHDKSRYEDSSLIDKSSGRAVHMSILSDPEIAQRIAEIIACDLI